MTPVSSASCSIEPVECIASSLNDANWMDEAGFEQCRWKTSSSRRRGYQAAQRTKIGR